jgi:hypothetical protein
MSNVLLQNFIPFNTVITSAWLNPLDALTIGNLFRYGVNPAAGAQDISSAITAAFAVTPFIWLPPSTNNGVYIMHDVVVPAGCTLFCPGAVVTDTGGTNWCIKLTGQGAHVFGLQINGSTTPSAIIIDDGAGAHMENIRVFNSVNPLLLKSTSNGVANSGLGCTRTQLINFIASGFSSIGIDIEPNVNNTQACNVVLDCLTVAGGGGQIPKVGVTGVRINSGSSVSGDNVGNTFTNTLVTNMQTGYMLTDSLRTKLHNCQAVNLSGFGCAFNSTTQNCDVDGLQAVNTGEAVVATGTTTANRVRNLRTVGTGVIPAGGGTTFYSSAGFTAPFFDIGQFNTATVTVDLDSWSSSGANAFTFTEAVAQAIYFTGGTQVHLTSVTTLAAGTTAYFGTFGQVATENSAVFQNVYSLVANVARVNIFTFTAPGVGQSVTYTLRVNGVATAITGSVTGTNNVAVMAGGPVSIVGNSNISLQAVSSAGAAAGINHAYIQFFPSTP